MESELSAGNKPLSRKQTPKAAVESSQDLHDSSTWTNPVEVSELAALDAGVRLLCGLDVVLESALVDEGGAS